MKKLFELKWMGLGLIASILTMLVVMSGCGPYQQQPVVYSSPPVVSTPVQTQGYQVIQDPTTGMQQVVYVDNSGLQQMMEYSLFMSLWNRGSWGSVYNYGYSHPTVIHVYDNTRYNSWRSTSSYGNYNRATYRPPVSNGLRSNGATAQPQFRNTSPANGLRSQGTSPPPSFRNTTPSNNGLRSTPSSNSFRSTTPNSNRSSGGLRSPGRH